MAAYQNANILLNNEAQTVEASESDAVLSAVRTLSAADTLNGAVSFNVSAVSVTTGVTAALQDSADGVSFTDVKTLSISDGSTGLKKITWHVQNETDQDYLPLRKYVRLVVDTGADDEITVDSVRISSIG